MYKIQIKARNNWHVMASKANKFPILGRYFQNNVGFQSNHFARVTTKQKDIKKAKYLSLII